MNVIVWARVSSREQREGYSIDAQLRASREKASRSGWTVAREFVVAESAKRGAERVVFNQLFNWVKANARRLKIQAILSHKLDRVCRNMRDAVRLQELEDHCGVQLAFVENQFGPGAAGALSFNVMAAVAQYYSDNLRTEVLKGMDEKVRQGWPTGSVPFGYLNVKDKERPVIPHPEKVHALKRIFELYARGDTNFRELAATLEREGYTYCPSQPRFNRTVLSWILSNRFYVGELRRNGQVHQGRYEQVISRETFEACQAVLKGRNRRTGSPNLSLSGGLLRCAYCGRSITGEKIRRRLKDGSVNEHVYYRCANNERPCDHPVVRWTEEELQTAIAADLGKLGFDGPELRDWFRAALSAAFSDLTDHRRRQRQMHQKRLSELTTMSERLLNAFLGGSVDEPTFKAKGEELRVEQARVTEALDAVGQADDLGPDVAVAVFDWCQNAGRRWLGSNSALRRQILDAVCLNRTLSDTTLCLEKRKPFDVLAEGLHLKDSRGDRIRTCDL